MTTTVKIVSGTIKAPWFNGKDEQGRKIGINLEKCPKFKEVFEQNPDLGFNLTGSLEQSKKMPDVWYLWENEPSDNGAQSNLQGNRRAFPSNASNPKKDATIWAQTALKCASGFLSGTDATPKEVLDTADIFLLWIQNKSK